MDPIEPWVDCDELRRLAHGLLAKPQAPTPPPPIDAAFGEEFEGYARAEEPVSAPAAPAPDRLPAPGPEQSRPPAAPPPSPPSIPPPAPEPAPIAAPVHSPVSDAAPVSAPPADPPTPPRPQRAAVQNTPQISDPPPMPEQTARQALAAAREIAQRGGLLVAPPADDQDALPEPALPLVPVPAPDPVRAAQLTQVSPVPVPAEAAHAVAPVLATTPFLARLQGYGTWLREGIRAQAFFVLDRDGGVLIDEVHSVKLQQVARTLAQASRTANRQAGAAAIGNLHIKVAPETILEVVPVMTRYGPLILGIIVDQPLSAQNVETVARGLQQVIDGVSGPSTS